MPFPVSALYVPVFALLLVMLSLRVILIRRSVKVSLGDGGDVRSPLRIGGMAATLTALILMSLALVLMNMG